MKKLFSILALSLALTGCASASSTPMLDYQEPSEELTDFATLTNNKFARFEVKNIKEEMPFEVVLESYRGKELLDTELLFASSFSDEVEPSDFNYNINGNLFSASYTGAVIYPRDLGFNLNDFSHYTLITDAALQDTEEVVLLFASDNAKFPASYDDFRETILVDDDSLTYAIILKLI